MEVLRAKLDLTESDVEDDDVSVVLSGIIVSAAHDSNPRHTLDQVYRAITAAELTGEIDPLATVPILLPSTQDIAQVFLNTVAEQTSAKELVIACEEATERLKNSLIHASSEEDDDDFESENKESVPAKVSPAQQMSRLLRVYARALPRLRPGKRSPSQTMKPLFSEFEMLIRFLGQNAEAEEGRDLVAAVAQLVRSLAPWIAQDAKDKGSASDVLYSLSALTLEVCVESISAGVAQAAFEQQFPRLRMPPRRSETSAPPPPKDVAKDVLSSLTAVGFITSDFETRRSLGSLVLLSRTSPPYVPTLSTATAFLPLLLTSIQTNTALEETLAFLLAFFGSRSHPSPTQPQEEIPSELLIPLAQVLPSLAGARPDASTRHIIFRLLSLVLSRAPPLLRMQLLQELLSDGDDQEDLGSTTPQMRVAAIGLVKEAVLDALREAGTENVWASPRFLQAFAPLVWRLHRVPERVESEEELREFLESPEPLRIVEALGLFYVVLLRDGENRTGIRDTDSIRSMQTQMLGPLKEKIASWTKLLDEESGSAHDHDEEHEHQHEHDQATMQIGILLWWLDKIDGGLAELGLAP